MAEVRPAVISDAPAIADVHVRAWQAAYRGMMPDELLDGLDVDERQQRWTAWLSGSHSVLVVEAADGRVAGFAATGAERDTRAAGLGELWVINLAPEHWGRGLGRALLAAATDQLRDQGFQEAVLWVVAGNARARRFYELAGWAADGAEKVDTDEAGVPEVRYRRRL